MSSSRQEPLRLGLPKGRFLDFSLRVLADLGCPIDVPRKSSWEIVKSGQPVVVKLLKVQDVTRLLQVGKLDLGVSADEWMSELGVQLPAVLDLAWCVTSVVLALPDGAARRGALGSLTIATPYPNLTRRFFTSKGHPCRILSVSGGTEALVPDICDGIVDCVETGQSLRDNRLEVCEVVMRRSSVRLFARPSQHSPALDEIYRVLECHRQREMPEISWNRLGDETTSSEEGYERH